MTSDPTGWVASRVRRCVIFRVLMRKNSFCYLLPVSLLFASAAASADPARLNNPAPPPPVVQGAPPPVAGYDAPPPVAVYNAPPPVAVYNPQSPMMMSQPPMLLRPPPPPSRQGLFVGVQGGAALPLVGDYGDLLGTGFMGLGHIGWATSSGISARAELGVRSNGWKVPAVAGTTLTSVFYGAGLRWTAPRATFRPYGEVLVDAFSTVAQATSASATTTSAGTGVSLGAALGGELELSDTLSLEIAVRYDHIVLNSDEYGLKGGLLGVLGGGTFYF